MHKLVLIAVITLLICQTNNRAKEQLIRREVRNYPDSTLKDKLPFPLGAAVKIRLLKQDDIYRSTVIREFSSITAENSMKFEALHPKENLYRWDNADYIVNFAAKNKIRVHGHVLHWPKANPEWVLRYVNDSTALENILKSHIKTVVRHFKGRVASWDVVNEAFDDEGKMKKSIWLAKLGPNYIGRCFKYAREADPRAFLFYNDYGQEYSIKKRHAIADMVNNFKKNGIPIDGIGIQMHTRVGVSEAKIRAAIDVLAKTGVKLHISELEISARSKTQNVSKMDPQREIQQAEKYELIFSIYNSIPSNQRFGITTWNVADADSWKNRKEKYFDFPLLFDHKYQPKKAYHTILKALN